jgi:phage baseplate assembly protein W
VIDDIRGFAFPFRIDPATGGVAVASGGAKIQQNVSIILSTREGERPMLREFGTRIHGLVQESNDAILASLLKDQVREALLRWEPRILITRAEVQQSESELQLALAYAHTSEPLAGEMIVPVR